MENSNKKKTTGRPKKTVDYNSPFAVRLRSLCDGKTQQEIADGAGVIRQNLGRFLVGETRPDIDTLCKLADYFNVSTDYLLCRTDIQTSDTTVQDICEYTGLSEEAIFNTKNITKFRISNRAVNLFLAERECNDLFFYLGEYSYDKLKNRLFKNTVLKKFIKDKYPKVSEKDLKERGEHIFRIISDNKLYGYNGYLMEFEFKDYYSEYLKKFSALDNSLSKDMGYEAYNLQNIFMRSIEDIPVNLLDFENEVNEIEEYFSKAVNSNMADEEYRNYIIEHLSKFSYASDLLE